MSKSFLDEAGVAFLWSKISLQDYPNNETLIAVLNAIDTTKADKSDIPTMDEIYNEIISRMSAAEEAKF